MTTLDRTETKEVLQSLVGRLISVEVLERGTCMLQIEVQLPEGDRRKPEKKYRPYTAAELVECMEQGVRFKPLAPSKHFGTSLGESATLAQISVVAGVSPRVSFFFHEQSGLTSEGLLRYFTHLDGTPCGVEE